MNYLTDLESRVLGVIEQRSGLEIDQVASAGRLSVSETTEALDRLVRQELITADQSKVGRTYQLNRHNVQKLIAA